MFGTGRKLRRDFVLAAFLSALCVLTAGCAEPSGEDGLRELELSGESKSGGKTDERAASESEEAENPDGTSGEEESGGKTVYVYVCGAVNSPGVYELERDARVFEAIRLAGGMAAGAAADAVNQARIVTDGEQIYVPTQEEARTQGAGVVESGVIEGTDNRKVNINTAGKEELMTLTGIGEAKAQSIMDYREKNGGFKSAEELMQIEGIKEGVFNKIKDDITI